jgi:hypothetical protein
MVRQKNQDGYDDVRPYYGENGLPVRFKPDQQTSPMYRQTMQFQQQRVDEARVKREGNPLPQFSNNEGYTPPDLTKPLAMVQPITFLATFTQGANNADV